MSSQTNTKKKKSSVEENPLARRNSQVYSAPAKKPARKPVPARRDDYDPYDYPERPPRPPRPANHGKRRKKKKKKSGFSFVSFLLLLAICGLVGVGVWRSQEYEEFTAMKAVVSRQTFYAGTTVDGIDVSAMTLQQALEHFNTQVEPAHRERAAVLNDGTRLTAEQLGYTSNYADILGGAWNAGRTGSLVERYHRMEQYSAQPTAYHVSRTVYDENLIRQYAAQLAQQVDRPSQNASVKDFNVETYAFEFNAGENGLLLDQESLVADIKQALDNGGGTVNMNIQTVAPEVTLENVSAQYGMVSSAVTDASSSSSNRLSNIRLALNSINGMWLDPGESFSFNEVVGKRTAERGYKSATAYSGGKVTEELGGGICQVSTTLFNAAVKADLKIDERHSHSLTVSYVDLGKDAAVDWDSKDLRFTNNSSDRVYICSTLTDDKRVRIGVFGKLLPDGCTITLESEKTGTREFETQYQMSFELSPGQTRVLQKGKNGYSAMAYKVWWDANGNELRRSELCKSNYSATPEIVEYGPG